MIIIKHDITDDYLKKQSIRLIIVDWTIFFLKKKDKMNDFLMIYEPAKDHHVFFPLNIFLLGIP